MADYITHLNLHQNELQNATLQNLAADPSTPKAGQFWYNTTTNKFCLYDGTSVNTYLTEAAFAIAIANYQAKITASGILKGDGAGGVTAATAGTDYDYPVITGATDPANSTTGYVTQHYLNTTSGVEFVCKAIDTSGETPVYTWVKVSADDSKQDKITASGILKGDGDGGVTAATAGTDYQAPIEVTAGKALVSDSNGNVAASSVTATELGYLSGVRSSIQDQLDAIPKLNYLDGVQCTVDDGASQSTINSTAIGVISTTYADPDKYDAVNVEIKFTPSDEIKNGLYSYDGTAWNFLYYTTTGIQRADGTTAGIIEEADVDAFDETETYAVGDLVKYSNKFYQCHTAVETAGSWTGSTNWTEIPFVSDLSLVDGVATVNRASQLRTARTIGIQGTYGVSSTDGISMVAATFDGTGNVLIVISGIKPEMLSAAVPVSKGGTGKSSITNGKMLVGNSSGGFDEIGIDNAVTASSNNLVTSDAVAQAIGGGNVAHSYTIVNPALTPASGLVSWEVTHNLDTTAVTVQLFEVATGIQVIPDVTITNANKVTIGIVSSTNIASETYRVVVIG